MNSLNKEQKEAVEYDNGPLLIIAGAGTGKTKVITERIRHLIESSVCKPSEILALTFTEKAAAQMEERIDVALPYGATTGMWIMTFHSFCDRILREEALHIGLDPKFKILTGPLVIDFIRRHIFELKLNYFLPLGNPLKFVEGLAKHFSRLQDENISPAEYQKWAAGKQKSSDDAKDEPWGELANAHQIYEELKIKESFMDYGDLIVNTLKLFKKRAQILALYQSQFKYILVDEFQDTNFAQNELVTLLASKNKNIAVVGDDNQAIYKFRGASVSNILQFRLNFPDAKTVVLKKNYRSNQTILDAAYKLIAFNNPDTLEAKEGIDKHLVSEAKNQKGGVHFIHTKTDEEEALEVVKKIKEHIKKNKYNFSDFAILTRANSHAEIFVQILEREGIPFRQPSTERIFEKPVIGDLIAYLKVVSNFEDSQSLFKLLSMVDLQIPMFEVIKLGNSAKRKNISLFEECEASQSEKIVALVGLIKKHIEDSKTVSAGSILYEFLDKFGILKTLVNPSEPEALEKAKQIINFFNKLKSYETSQKNSKLTQVLAWIDLAISTGEAISTYDEEEGADAVNVLTIHASKGLEYKVVFMVNLVNLRFPSVSRKDPIPLPDEIIKEQLPSGDPHIQEERRLFYVGMTRAKEYLYLTAAQFYSDGKHPKKLSNFIFETLGEEVTSHEVNNGIRGLEITKAPIKKITKNKTHVDFLSYSQIETFKTCPLHYYLRYIVMLPTPPTGAQSFGISIHAALKSFYESVKNGSEATKKLMQHVLEENWFTEGYENKIHADLSFEKAKNYLNDYFKNTFSLHILPQTMEQKFLIDLPQLKLGGTIDRIDDLGGGNLEIIDYKTGSNIPTQKDVDKNLQLTIYALTLPDVEKLKLSLYYFETQTKISTVRTKQDLEKAKEEILKIREEIENSDFVCNKSFFCEECEYASFCNR